MRQIPFEYLKLIPEVLEWHTATFDGSSFIIDGNNAGFDSYECQLRLKRILDRWYREHRVAEQGVKPFEIEDKEVYFLRIAMSDAVDEWSTLSLKNIQEQDVRNFLEWLSSR